MIACHRLIYLSRNESATRENPEASIEQILATSRRNNTTLGVTGSLMFNAGLFAQVLEGPRPTLEALFERIQQDARHSAVRILQFEPVQVRLFPDWAMAWAGREAAPLPEFVTAAGDVHRFEASDDRMLRLLGAYLDAEGEPSAEQRAKQRAA